MMVASGLVRSPISQFPTTPEWLFAQVRGELVAGHAGARTRQSEDLDQLAETAVRSLWDGA
jgi:hypothetical protein